MNMRVLATVGLIGSVACGTVNPGGSAHESAVRQFYVDVNTFDHAAIRATTTSDFELLDGGRRMDGGAFESFMRGIESGGGILDFDLSALNTEVAGDVAYTSYLATVAYSIPVSGKFALAFHSDDVELRQEVESALECMKPAGMLADLHERWFGFPAAEDTAINAVYMGYGHSGIEGHDPEAHVPPCS